MTFNRWVGSHPCERSTDIINGYPSRNERAKTNTLDLDDLIRWLEYGKVSGYIAARQSKEQEEYWAKLIREIMIERLISKIVWIDNSEIRFECTECGIRSYGKIYNSDYTVENDLIVDLNVCSCLIPRKQDIIQYIISIKEEGMINYDTYLIR